MSNTPTTPNPADLGLASGPAPAPAMPSAIQPLTPQTAPDSNAPDTDTQAAASIPKALVNNPQVPSQKIAAQVDANKTSPAPAHNMLYKAAIEMTGGARVDTTYDANGNVTRTPREVKPWALGLALALEVLRGGLAGASAPKGQEAAAGAQLADRQRQAVKQANVEEDTQAKQDLNYKLAVTEANMRIYQTAVNVGKSSKETSQTFVDSFKPISEGLQDGTIVLPEGVTKEEAFETDAMAAIANGKTNITHDIMIPVGDPQPVIDPQTKQQAIVNGAPAWGHTYMTIHGADKFQTVLTKDMQDKLHEIGYFQEGGKDANIGEPQWSFADIMKKMSLYASVKAGEQLLQDHKNDAHDLLDRKAEDLEDISAAVRTNPAMRKAVGLFAQAQQGTSGANSHIEDILNTMASKDPQAASTLMHYLKLSPKDLDDMHNMRAAEEAKAKAKTPVIQPDTDDKARMIANDPKETPERRKLAQAVLDAKSDEAKSLKLKELQDTRAIQDQDINQAAANIIRNPADTTTIKSISSMRGDERLRLYNKIHELQPNYDTGKIDAKVKVLNDFSDGKAADNIVAYNTFLGHALDASEAVNQFRGTGGNVSPLINKGLNWLDKNAANDPTYAAFKTALIPVQKEFMNFLNNNRAEHEQDAEDMKTVIDPTSTPAQIQATLKKLAQSGDIRLTQLGRKYQNTMGVPYENLYSPEGKAAIMRLTIPRGTTRIQQPSGAFVDVPSANAAAIIKQHPQLKIVGQEQ